MKLSLVLSELDDDASLHLLSGRHQGLCVSIFVLSYTLASDTMQHSPKTVVLSIILWCLFFVQYLLCTLIK